MRQYGGYAYAFGHTRFGGDYPDLAQRKRHSLAQLILPRHCVREKRALHGSKVAIRFSAGIENRLIRKVGSVQRELRVQPSGNSHLLQLLNRGRRGPPRGLIQQPGSRQVADLRRCRLSEGRNKCCKRGITDKFLHESYKGHSSGNPKGSEKCRPYSPPISTVREIPETR